MGDRPNFMYTKYKCVDGKWEKVIGNVPFSTRARSARGCANAMRKAIGRTSCNELYLGYGYMFYEKDDFVRIVYAPVSGRLDAYVIIDGDDTDYKHSKSNAMVEVSRVS